MEVHAGNPEPDGRGGGGVRATSASSWTSSWRRRRSCRRAPAARPGACSRALGSAPTCLHLTSSSSPVLCFVFLASYSPHSARAVALTKLQQVHRWVHLHWWSPREVLPMPASGQAATAQNMAGGPQFERGLCATGCEGGQGGLVAGGLPAVAVQVPPRRARVQCGRRRTRRRGDRRRRHRELRAPHGRRACRPDRAGGRGRAQAARGPRPPRARAPGLIGICRECLGGGCPALRGAACAAWRAR